MNLLIEKARSRWSRVAIGVLVALCAVAALTIAASSKADSTTSDDRVVVEAFPPVVAPAEAAAQHAAFAERFGLLRRPEVAMPESSVVVDQAIDRAAVHVIRSASGKQLAAVGAEPVSSQLWVAPRQDGTECILAQPRDAQGPAEICATLDGAASGQLLMTQTWSASDLELYGLVPDGVEEVRVEFADGSAVALPVVDNAYAAHFRKPTEAVVFVGADGLEHRVLARIDA